MNAKVITQCENDLIEFQKDFQIISAIYVCKRRYSNAHQEGT